MVPFAQGRSSAATRLGTDALAAALKGALAAVASRAKRTSVTGRSARRTRSQPTAPASSATTMTRRRSSSVAEATGQGPDEADDAGRRDQRRRHPQGGVRLLVDGERERDLRGVRSRPTTRSGRATGGGRRSGKRSLARTPPRPCGRCGGRARRSRRSRSTVRPLGRVRRTCTRRVVSLGAGVDAGDEVERPGGVLQHVARPRGRRVRGGRSPPGSGLAGWP